MSRSFGNRSIKASALAAVAVLCLAALGRQGAALTYAYDPFRFYQVASGVAIDAIAPPAAAPGDTVVITGRNFNQLVPQFPNQIVPATWIKFGNSWGFATRATWVYESPTRIRATVPADAISGPIYMTQQGSRHFITGEINWVTIARSPTTFTVLPVAPTNLRATTLGFNAIQLDWSYNGTGQTGFKAQFRPPGGSWQDMPPTLGANARSQFFLPFPASSTFELRIAALKGILQSNPSGTASATTGAAPSVTITNGSLVASPFQDSGPVAEIVSARAFIDMNLDGRIDLAATEAPQDPASFFPRFVTGVSGNVLRGNRIIAPGNCVIVVKFRTRPGRPVQFACVHADIDANGTLIAATMLAGDFDLRNLVLGLQSWNQLSIAVQPATVPGRIRGTADGFLFVDSPFDAAAGVRFTFDLLLEHENRFTE